MLVLKLHKQPAAIRAGATVITLADSHQQEGVYLAFDAPPHIQIERGVFNKKTRTFKSTVVRRTRHAR